jgi:drug/metabolite transporter (DMT)-like permease
MTPSALQDSATVGIAWMVLATIGYSINAGLVKYLSADLNTMEMVFWRSVFAIAFLLPWLWRNFSVGVVAVQRQWKLFVLRGFLTYAAMATTYFALANMPIADVYALQFTNSLFTILGAVLILGERVGFKTWMACAVGFGGALIILRPGFEQVTIAALAALASAILYSATNVTIKILSRTEATTTITVFGNLIMLIISAVPILISFRLPPVQVFPWIIALAVFTTLGQWCLARAIGLADARVVWPFDFLRLPFTALIGWFFFAQLPDIWTWSGAIVIFSAGYYVIRLEARELKG